MGPRRALLARRRVKNDKRILYVGGLEDEVDLAVLRAAFIPFGEVLRPPCPRAAPPPVLCLVRGDALCPLAAQHCPRSIDGTDAGVPPPPSARA
jgi:hypothetical protein